MFPSSLPGRVVVLFLMLARIQVDVCLAQEPDPTPQPTPEIDVYRYRMKGKVRLLFFWVGKDNVGGGTISFGEFPDGPKSLRRSIEVLFGSNPARVPGGINRWGYGTETALWVEEDNRSTLKQTLFEGFMKHSGEEKLSEVRANAAAAQGDFLYDGTRSLVLKDEATSELRMFSSPQDFDYTKADPMRCLYQKRIESGGPDRQRRLEKPAYGQPYGFLTAINQFVVDAVDEYAETRTLKRPTRPLDYVYNAQAFELSVRNKSYLGQFEVPSGSEAPATIYPSVARVEFRLRKMINNNQHDFTLWVPLQGELKGIPIRIVDKPRWWLAVELNLEAGSLRRIAAPGAGVTATCE